jgi:hypothetical protein
MEWYDIERLINLVLMIALLPIMIRRAHRDFVKWTPRGLDVWWSAFAWVISAIVGTIEQLWFDGNMRVVMVTFAVIVTFKWQLSRSQYFKSGDEGH